MPSFYRMQAILWLKRAAILGVFLGIATFAYWQVTGRKEENSIVGDQYAERNTKLKDLGDTSFEEFLERASIENLIDKSKELADDRPEPVALRLDRQRRRRLIAERLSLETGNQKAINAGLIAEIDSRRINERVKRDAGISVTDPRSLNELTELAQQHIDHSDKAVKKHAFLAKVSAEILADLLQNASTPFQFSEKALASFDELCTTYSDDDKIANQLLLLMAQIFSANPQLDQSDLLASYSGAFSTSENEKCREYSQKVRTAIDFFEFELADVFSATPSQQAETIQTLRNQILAALVGEDISANGYQRIFDAIRDIVRCGDYDQAKELTAKFDIKTRSQPELSLLAEQNQKLQKQIEMNGKKIPNIFEDFEGKQYEFRSPSTKIRAVCFMHKNSFNRADKLLSTIVLPTGPFRFMRLAPLVKSNQLSLTAVFVDYGDSEEATAMRRGEQCKSDQQGE